MDYYFEEPTVKKVKVNIEPCPCCGSQSLKFDKCNTGNGADTFGGYAYIECSLCHHKVKKESNNIGWGDTLDGLFRQVLFEWNGQCRRHQYKDQLLIKALAVALNSYTIMTAHVAGDGIEWIAPNGDRGFRDFSSIEKELDRLIERMKTSEGGK